MPFSFVSCANASEISLYGQLLLFPKRLIRFAHSSRPGPFAPCGMPFLFVSCANASEISLYGQLLLSPNDSFASLIRVARGPLRPAARLLSEEAVPLPDFLPVFCFKLRHERDQGAQGIAL